jgi:hypothetical protein
VFIVHFASCSVHDVVLTMGTLSTELAPHVERLANPRVYADANVPAGIVTIDRDYLDDRRFPPARSPGVLVVWAPNERLLARTLQRVDAVLFRPSGEAAPPALPLEGRKLVVDPAWTGDVPKHCT